MKHFFHHLFFPHESNNHRAKLLHHDSLLIVIAFFLFLFSFFAAVHNTNPQVLGITSNISTQELLVLTNRQRVAEGLAPLSLSNELSNAAAEKANHMFTHNYWAHIAPDGTTPWYFIRHAGYEYLYAGENLARGFTTAPDTVAAWMASPTHRENMLSKNYTEIGFSIQSGTLTGSETVLIVEMFGSRYPQEEIDEQQAVVVPPPAVIAQISPTVAPSPLPTTVQEQVPLQVAAVQNKPLVDSNSWTRNISLFLLLLFIAVLLIDMIIIERRKIVRVVAHNVDHILFFVVLVLALLVIGRGVIL